MGATAITDNWVSGCQTYKNPIQFQKYLLSITMELLT